MSKRSFIKVFVFAVPVFVIAGTLYFIQDSISSHPGSYVEKTAVGYRDIGSKVESVSPSRRYAIISLLWDNGSRPYKYFLQDMRGNKQYEFPEGAIDLAGIDIPAIISWSPRENRVLIAFKPAEAPGYVRAYKITDKGIFPKKSLPPSAEPRLQYSDVESCEAKQIYWLDNANAVIDMRISYRYDYRSEDNEPPYKILKKVERYLYNARKGFKNI